MNSILLRKNKEKYVRTTISRTHIPRKILGRISAEDLVFYPQLFRISHSESQIVNLR